VSATVGSGWEGAPLDAGAVDPRGIVSITVGFDEGEEVLTPKTNERFGAYDLYEASRYLSFLSNHIREGTVTRG
jgi:hypothetical protein